MKLSLNWIKDFVDLKGIKTEDIVTRLGLATSEIEGVEEKGNLAGCVVGRIVTCEPHPERKKLNVLTVDNGSKIVNVICGAPNCRVGLTVAFAKVGSTIGDIKVGIATIAGFESHGMCMSEHELGISTDHDGIIELPDTLQVGTDIHKVLPDLRDTLIEIDNKSLTNRPDLWGHYGFARELSAIFGRKLKPINVALLDKYETLEKLPVAIEKDAPAFALGTIRIENITLPKSPIQMRTRLFYCGINSHEFLVDLSNYIMLELGQPNHAFDLRKIKKLSVGTVKEGTEFITLKDQVIKATPSMLFIKDGETPVSLAGIMGGKNSSIDAETTGTMFEVATFDATSIRRTSQATGIRSDASARYEKALDVALGKMAVARIVEETLRADKKAKVTSAFSQVIPKPQATIKIKLEKEYLERFAGMKFNYTKVKAHLTALGFAPVITAKTISVTVPSWRATKDISNRADVIEEIVRMFGYDNVVPVAPKKTVNPRAELPHLVAQNRIKDILVDKYSMTEVHTYIWNSQSALKELNITTPSYLSVVNSVVQGSEQIRSEISPSLIHVASKNPTIDDIGIFEIARVYKKDGEKTVLGILCKDYKTLSEVVTDVMRLVSMKISYDIGKSTDVKYLHPKNNAVVNSPLSQGEYRAGSAGRGVVPAGFIGSMHPSVNVKNGYAVAEIILDGMFDEIPPAERMKFSKFPSTTLDFTFTTSRQYGELANHFDKFEHKHVMSYRLKDVFENNYTLEFKVGSYEKTLTGEDIQELVDTITKYGGQLT